jgi:organic radical activating enzyme
MAVHEPPVENESNSTNPDHLLIASQQHGLLEEAPALGEIGILVEVAGCNLTCGNLTLGNGQPSTKLKPSDGATWACDKVATWSDHESVHTAESLMTEWDARGWISVIEGGHTRNIVLSGGEPMLPGSQDAWADFFGLLTSATGETPSVQVHTNGTHLPSRRLRSFVDTYVVSPKLSNSGLPESTRLNDQALFEFGKYANVNGIDTEFVFLISTIDDLQEVNYIRERFNVPSQHIVLMTPREMTDKKFISDLEDSIVENGYRLRHRHRSDS